MKKIAKTLSVTLLCLMFAAITVFSVSAAALGRVTNLKASSVTYNSVKLSWSAVDGAVKYQLQQRKGDGAWTTVSNSITKTSYTVKSLSTGSTYSFQVRALASSTANNGRYSTDISVTPLPAKVTGLKATAASISSAKLSWTKTSGASGYQIQKYAGSKWTHVAYTTSTSYTAKKLTVDSTTKFRVRAYKTVSGTKKYGTASSSVSFKAGVPKVTDFKISSQAYNSVTFTWKKASNITGYQVYKYDFSNKGWKRVKSISSASTVKYTDKTLKPGTKYAFKVRAYYKGSKTYYGDFCSNVYITPKLNTVTGLSLTTLTATKATLTWNKVDGAQGYQVYDYSTGSAKKLPTVSTNKTTITVDAGKEYKIKVRAYTKATSTGETVKGAFCDACSFYTKPDKVTDFTASILDDGSIGFTWKAVSGAAGYKLNVINNTTGKWDELADVTSDSYTLADPSSLPGKIFTVAAYVKNGSSLLMGDVSSTYTLTVLTTPEIAVGERTETDITLTWSKVTGADTYVLQSYNYNKDAWETVTETADTQYTATKLSVLGEKVSSWGNAFRVYAKSQTGSRSPSSESVNAYTKDITLVQDGAAQVLSWTPAFEGAHYEICVRYQYENREFYDKLATVTQPSATLSLTPGSMQLISIYAMNDSNFATVINELIFKVDPLKVVPTTHEHYNESVNGQLLYLVDAINKTKDEQTKVTVASNSTVTFNTDNFYLTTILGQHNFSGNNVESMLNFLAELGNNLSDEEMEEFTGIALSGQEIADETLSFNGGVAKNSQGATVVLKRFIDPADRNYAELYGCKDPSAWKNGFSSVSVTPLASGGYKYSFIIKEELFGNSVEPAKPEALYHPGFATTVASLGYFSDGQLKNETTTIGNTVITATVNAQGTLDSYSVNSPFSIKMSSAVDFPLVYAFGLQLSGSIVSNYKFTR